MDRPTILVVDDTPENLAVAVGLLGGECRIKVARSGARALKIAGAVPHPDLVLLDIMMPGMDGYEVCRVLKADPELASIPVIFLTARMQTEDVVHGFALGAADYVPKPFRPEELLARLRTHLEIDARRTTSRPGTAGERGTGFGMPLARKLVTAYGGGIEVASREQAEDEPDPGTEVRVTLRAAPAGT